MGTALPPVVLAALLVLTGCGGGGGSAPAKASVVGPIGKGGEGVYLFRPAGGIPNGSRSPCTTSVGTVTASSSGSRLGAAARPVTEHERGARPVHRVQVDERATVRRLHVDDRHPAARTL